MKYISFLYPVEKLLLFICLLLAICSSVLLTIVDANIDYIGYSGSAFIIIVLFVGGFYYRTHRKGGEGIGVTVTAAAILILFSNVSVVLNYLLLGLPGENIDSLLVQIDLQMGFHWPAFLKFMSQYPTLSLILGYAYNSTLIQVILITIYFGFSGKTLSLYRFIAYLMVSALIMIVFWAFFPSFGTTAVYTIPADIESIIKPIVGNFYGEKLKALSSDNIPTISPTNIQGLIAFPSYHTIMTLFVCISVMNLGNWKYFIYLINVLVLLSIPLHGGHHLVDLVGALVVTAISIIIVQLMYIGYVPSSLQTSSNKF